ncbi:MAG: penicillin acylase family protein [Desulfobacterales bacterium]|nr:penicillin acylase family protein [Desulfobacterales bacterium]
MIGKSAVKAIVIAFIFLITSTTAFGNSSDVRDGKKGKGIKHTNSFGKKSQGIKHTNSFGKKVKITRDDKGVWFITGGKGINRYYVFEAMGYAVATDRIWQMELYKRQSLGRLSEIFGIDQLGTDIYLRTIGYSEEELTEGVENLDPGTFKIVQGYVAGINRRISEIENNPSLLPAEFSLLGLTTIEKWRCQDVLAWIAMLQKNFDPEALDTAQLDNAALFQKLTEDYGSQAEGMFNDLRWTNDPEAQTYIVDESEIQQTSSTAKKSSRKNNAFSDYDAETIAKTADKLKKNREKVIKKLKDINAFVKMGSYAWVVAGDKTESGNPIIYSGPQMGFSVPSIVTEGSIRAGGLDVSGMTIPGIPGIIIGRTPHHAWSMQVGHAHTTDYYFETPGAVLFHRFETIKVKDFDDVTIPIYKTAHGPVISPMPYDGSPGVPIVSWKYSQWGYEFNTIEAFLDLADAKSMNEFGEGIEKIGVSQHFCYADRDGNIAYWMSGRNPVRPAGEWRLPQGLKGSSLEWDSSILAERSTARNPERGYFGGWNNKTNPDYDNGYNSISDIYGPFHRSHVIYDYFDTAFEEDQRLSFDDVRDLALNIAATDSFGRGGNPWKFVEPYFKKAVTDAKTPTDANTTEDIQARQDALELLSNWDGHFVEGGESMWAAGPDRADAWVLMNAWIREVLSLAFDDELGESNQDALILFNVLLHGLAGSESGIVNNYSWFENTDLNAPQTAEKIIVAALDTVLAQLGDTPWGENARGQIIYNHAMLGPIHSHPFSSRSTYAHCVEYGADGPVRIESMFPLGQSGNILSGGVGGVTFDDNFFSMTEFFDNFVHREFPLFD